MTVDILVSEVGPRDGLQSLKVIMPTAAKKAWIKAEADAGVREIEVGSFVPPKLLPQMADCEELVRYAVTIPGLNVATLAPNLKGVERAVSVGAHKVSIPISASETHSRANLRKGHDEILEEVRRINEMLSELPESRRPHFEAGIATAFGCTMEGPVPESMVLKLANALMEAGCRELGLSDTTGYANPAQIRRLVRLVRAEIGAEKLTGVHFAQHPRPGPGQRHGSAGRRHYHAGQFPGRHRRLSLRTRRQRQYRDRRPGLHAGVDGIEHRHRPGSAAQGARSGQRGPAEHRDVWLHAGRRPAAGFSPGLGHGLVTVAEAPLRSTGKQTATSNPRALGARSAILANPLG